MSSAPPCRPQCPTKLAIPPLSPLPTLFSLYFHNSLSSIYARLVVICPINGVVKNRFIGLYSLLMLCSGWKSIVYAVLMRNRSCRSKAKGSEVARSQFQVSAAPDDKLECGLKWRKANIRGRMNGGEKDEVLSTKNRSLNTRFVCTARTMYVQHHLCMYGTDYVCAAPSMYVWN